MAISTMDDVVAALGAAYPQALAFQKASATAEGAGTFHSLWKVAGVPAAGSNPPAYTAGSGYSPARNATGAWAQNNPAVGNELHLLHAQVAAATAGTLVVYDRLWACSALLTNTTSAQNITTPGSIPSRDAAGAGNGNGVELWLEVYSAPGATTATWTVSYTNQAGTSGRSGTYTHPANAESVGQMMPVTLQAGDTGVQAVASLTCSASSGTAGDVGITLLRKIAVVPFTVVNVAQSADMFALGKPRIYDDSCLAFMVVCSTTNTGFMQGLLRVGEG